jgi:transcription elongation factor GreB
LALGFGGIVSKAFTRESDDDAEDVLASSRPVLPPGVKNYITPTGAQRLRDEAAELAERKRQIAAASSEPGQAAPPQPGPEQRKIEARIRQVQQILETVVVTEPPGSGRDVVRFGAAVTVRRANSQETIYRIVGVDETDLDRGWISWLSPLAKQLVGKRAGDRVRFRFPGGDEELVVTWVAY